MFIVNDFRKCIWLVVAIAFLVQQPGVAAELVWVPVGTADFLDPNSWSPNQIPTINDDPVIRNGGSATTSFGESVEVNTLRLGDAAVGGDGSMFGQADVRMADSLLVGANSSSEEITSNLSANGQFDLASASLFQIDSGVLDQDLRVGIANVRNGSNVFVGGRTTINDVTNATLGGDLLAGGVTNKGGRVDASGVTDWLRVDAISVAGDIQVARSDLRGTDANVAGLTFGDFRFSNITDFDVGGNVGLGTSHYEAGPAYPFRMDHTSTAIGAGTALDGFVGIEDFNIGGNLDIGTATVNFQPGAEPVIVEFRSAIEFTQITKMSVDGDLRTHSMSGTVEDSPLTFQQVESVASNAANFFRVNLAVGGGMDTGVLELNSSSSAEQGFSNFDVNSQLYFETSRVVTGETTRAGIVSGTANLARAQALGRFGMNSSILVTPELRLGLIETTTSSGSATAELSLFPSFIDTDLMVQGDGGTTIFHLGGLDRMSPGRFDGTLSPLGDSYSAIDAADASLAGNIIADFDFVPPSPGTYSFDLVQSESSSALDDTTANLSIVNLPEGFCVLFYGIAEDSSGDVLRLTISTTCVPEPSCLVLVSIGMCVLALGSRRRNNTVYDHQARQPRQSRQSRWPK